MELSVSVQQFLQFALLGIVTFVVPVLAYQSYKWIKANAEQIKSQLDANQLYLLEQFVAIAVKAMEQAQLKEQLEATAEQLLAGAVAIVQSYLDAHGITAFSVEDIVSAIRAALRDGVHKAEDENKPV